MKKTALKFGIISGVIVSTFMAVSMAVIDCDAAEAGSGSMILGFGAMIVAFSFIFVGIKNYRDKQNGGSITFGKGLLLGLTISLIASTLYVLTWAVEFHLFMPDFMDKYAAIQVEDVQARLSGPELDAALQKIETESHRYKNNPFFFTLYTYMEILPVGILISLISALILRRKPAVAGV